ncbi:MAG: DUF6526 family protein [Rhodothermales bacterium]|nr:DUF6526 family protein [Rhodothermales bacterium]
MRVQSFSNHTRLVPGFHVFLAGLILLSFAGAMVNLSLTYERGANSYSAALIAVILVCLAMLFYYARVFALRAQDRAIRAEENFRHYVLTGRMLDQRLSMPQIVALRFASDGELPELAERAASQNLSNRDIKKAVQHWRADHNRA